MSPIILNIGGANFPAAQLVHDWRPGLGLYVPAGHPEHGSPVYPTGHTAVPTVMHSVSNIPPG